MCALKVSIMTVVINNDTQQLLSMYYVLGTILSVQLSLSGLMYVKVHRLVLGTF